MSSAASEPTMDRDAAIAQARKMRETARVHHRAQDSHRKKMKRVYVELNEFCKRHGIEYILEEADTQPRRPGGPGDDQGTSTDG